MQKSEKEINCMKCKKSFYVYRYRFGKAKYCSHHCANASHDPWNKGLKDVQKAPNTAFKKGHISWNYIDGRSKNPIRRKLIKGIPETHYIWCNIPCSLLYVPKGFVIHHLDFNPLNNSPENLFLMQGIDHRKYHNQIIKYIKNIGGNSNSRR